MAITVEFVQACMSYLRIGEKIVILHSREVDPSYLNNIITVCNRVGAYSATTYYERFTRMKGNGCLEDACKGYSKLFGGNLHIVGLRGKQGTPKLFYVDEGGAVYPLVGQTRL